MLRDIILVNKNNNIVIIESSRPAAWPVLAVPIPKHPPGIQPLQLVWEVTTSRGRVPTTNNWEVTTSPRRTLTPNYWEVPTSPQ